MKITLIVPFYNETAHIVRCIDSIKRQIFTDFEALLIDDLSTDDSYAVAKKMTEGDERFRLMQNDAKGLFHARNKALAEAQGEYLCFLDADDELLPNYIQELYDDMHESRVDLVVQGFDHVVNGHHDEFRVKTPGVFDAKTQAQDLYSSFDIVDMGNVFGKLYRMQVIKEHQLCFSPKVLLSEDMFFVVSYLACCKKICLSTKSNYLYIAHKKSMSTYYWDFTTEQASFLELKRVWNCLLQKNDAQSLYATFGTFVGNYVNRLIFTNLIHPNAMSRKDNFLIIEQDYLPLYSRYYQPSTAFTRMLKWSATHRFYCLYQLLMRMAIKRYGIVVNFG